VQTTFDRARLETDDDDSRFPPAEPASFRPIPTPSGRPSGRPSNNGVEQRFYDSPPPVSLAPPSLPPAPARKPSRARLVFAKFLFATLFGSIAFLLGYALLTKNG
jgi:hypothetical protein